MLGAKSYQLGFESETKKSRVETQPLQQFRRGSDNRVACLIDGDDDLLSENGGREAARLLTEAVRCYLLNDPTSPLDDF